MLCFLTKRRSINFERGLRNIFCYLKNVLDGHVFSYSVFKPSAVLKLLEQYGCPNTCTPNYNFFYLHSV